MSTPACRDLSAVRRARAAECVARHRAELAALLAADGLTGDVVEGSAVAAEVYLAETNTLHTAVRIALFFGRGDLDAIARSLHRCGFERAEPSGDATLLRLAGRSGRRAIHVLFAGDDGATDDARLHPGDPAAHRARARRLGTAWLDVATAFRRVRHASADDQDVTETFEVQMIERPLTAG